MIQKDTASKVTESVALILKDAKEVDLFSNCLVSNELKKITSFLSAKEAYEVAVRQQFTLFVTRIEMNDMNGLILIQKMRETGNYGVETHLIVCDKIEPASLSVLYEYDLPYIIVAPLKKETIIEKIKYLIEKENALSPEEQLFRDARAAYNNNILEMAEVLLNKIFEINPNLEKAMILMGDLCIKQGNITLAEHNYDLAVKANPKSFVAASKLAGCYLAKGLFEKSTPIFNSLFEINKYNIKMLEKAGLSNIQSKDYVNAQKNIQQLKTVDEKNQAASTMQVKIKIIQGDYEGLAKILSETHSELEMIKFLNSEGIKLSKEKNPESAIKMYQACLNEVKSNQYLYAVHYNLGFSYKMLNNIEEAKDAFKKSLELKPDFEKAQLALKELSKL